MRSMIFSFLLGALFVSGPLFSQNFNAQFREFMRRPEYANASAGIHVIDVNSGEILFDYQSEKLLIPASTLKLVTAAAALGILGPDYHFTTRLGYTGEITGKTLAGDIVITGGGDPALGSAYFQDHYFSPSFLKLWAEQLYSHGIEKVEGELLLDGSLYDQERIPPTWIWEDMGNYYGAAANGLTYHDNLFHITFCSPSQPGQPTTITSVFPQISGIKIDNEVRSSLNNRDLAFVFGSPLDGQRIIRGTIPKNRKAFTIKASNPFPGQQLARDFRAALAEKGIYFTGGSVQKMVDSEKIHPLFVRESPELRDILQVMNHESVNLYAEHIIRQIAAEKGGSGSREAGLKFVEQYLSDQNLNTRELVMEDGSGLSHFNLVTPRFLTSLLANMSLPGEYTTSFMHSLASAGEGTLTAFQPVSFPGNTLRAKSGSMTRVRCLAGYLKTDRGNTLAFAFMFNHFTGPPAFLAEFMRSSLLVFKESW